MLALFPRKKVTQESKYKCFKSGWSKIWVSISRNVYSICQAMLLRLTIEWRILVLVQLIKKSYILSCYWNPKHFQVLCMDYNSKDGNFPSLLFLVVLTFSTLVEHTRLTSLENTHLSSHRSYTLLMFGLFHSDLWPYFLFDLISLCWSCLPSPDNGVRPSPFSIKKYLFHSSCINPPWTSMWTQSLSVMIMLSSHYQSRPDKS